MNDFRTEINYSLDSDLQWTLVNKRVSLYLKQIQEHKFYAFVALFCTIFLIIFGPQNHIINMLFGFSCTIWGMTFAYTSLTGNKYISIAGNMELAYKNDSSESFFMLMNEMKFSLSIIRRDLKRVELLNTVATCYTVVSILCFVMEFFVSSTQG